MCVFGNDYDTPDGTGVRDYIHVVDLARGHVHALQAIQKNISISDKGVGHIKVYNLGTGTGYSVLEMIKALEVECQHSIPYRIAERRPGDLASVYADTQLAEKELLWKANLGLKV